MQLHAGAMAATEIPHEDHNQRLGFLCFLQNCSRFPKAAVIVESENNI